mmetsp:Transcript_76352/g.221696  ORF Transcript_76352/g.221696 Transcript_76352/m.221696 type:complete len:261 (-) Transcript_76352:5328-6110(-)
MWQDELLRAGLLGLDLKLVVLQGEGRRRGAEQLVVELTGPLVKEAQVRDEMRGRIEGQERNGQLRRGMGLYPDTADAQVERLVGLAPLRLNRIAVSIADHALAQHKRELRILIEGVLQIDVHSTDLIQDRRHRDGLLRLATGALAAKLEDHRGSMYIALPARREDDLALHHPGKSAVVLNREGHRLLRLDLDHLLLHGEIAGALQLHVVGDRLLGRIGELDVLCHVHAEHRTENDHRLRHIMRQVHVQEHDEQQHVLRLR